MTSLAIPEATAAALFDALADDPETAWVMSARTVAAADLLLGRRLEAVPTDAYAVRSRSVMTITSKGFVPAFEAARRDGDTPIFVHTHPGGPARWSARDEIVDDTLRAYAVARGGAGYGSLVIGGTPDRPTFGGRYYRADAEGAEPINRLRVAGRRFKLMRAEGDGDGAVAPMFDRNVRAFGQDGQRLLGQLRVGVVGAGGTGSAVVEMLVRLGVGYVTVWDPDEIDETNITRIHGSVATDVGTMKVDVASRLASEAETGTKVLGVPSSVVNRAGIEGLSKSDVIFGCTDDHAGRLVLSRLAYRYLVPVIDCGVVVDSADGEIRGVTGRVSVMAPGEPCLVCRGQVDPAVAAAEMLDPARRAALAGEGYTQGEVGPAPAVVAYTTATAAAAVSELLGRLFGFATSDSTQILLRFDAQSVSRAGRPARDGHQCTRQDEWGLGDTDPPLGIVGLR